MIKREGKTCKWCGYPLAGEHRGFCVTCENWIASTGGVRTAAKYAGDEGRKELNKYYEERKR